MAKGECPDPQPDCKYAPECFSDNDHLIPRRLGTSALKREYLRLPQHQEQVCRRLHDERNERHYRGDTSDIPPFPDNAVMRDEIVDTAEKGLIRLTKSKRKKLGLG